MVINNINQTTEDIYIHYQIGKDICTDWNSKLRTKEVLDKGYFEQNEGYFIVRSEVNISDYPGLLGYVNKVYLGKKLELSITYKFQNIEVIGTMYEAERLTFNTFYIYFGIPGKLEYNEDTDLLKYEVTEEEIEKYINEIAPIGHIDSAIPEPQYKEEISELREERDELKGQIPQIIKEKEYYKDNYEKNKKELNIAKTNNSKLTQEKNELDRKYNNVKEEFENYKKSHSEEESEVVKGLNKQIEEKNKAINTLEEKVDKLEENIEEKEDKIEEINETIKKLKVDFEALVTKEKARITEETSLRIDTLRNQLQQYGTENSALKGVISTNKAEISKITNENNEIKGRNEELNKQIVKQQETIDNLTKIIEELEDDEKKKEEAGLEDKGFTAGEIGAMVAGGVIGAGVLGLGGYCCFSGSVAPVEAAVATSSLSVVEGMKNSLNSSKEKYIEMYEELDNNIYDEFGNKVDIVKKEDIIDNINNEINEYKELENTIKTDVKETFKNQMEEVIDNTNEVIREGADNTVKTGENIINEQNRINEVLKEGLTEEQKDVLNNITRDNIDDFIKNGFKKETSKFGKINEYIDKLKKFIDKNAFGKDYLKDLGLDAKDETTKAIKNHIGTAVDIINDAFGIYLRNRETMSEAARTEQIQRVEREIDRLLQAQRKYEEELSDFEKELKRKEEQFKDIAYGDSIFILYNLLTMAIDKCKLGNEIYSNIESLITQDKNIKHLYDLLNRYYNLKEQGIDVKFINDNDFKEKKDRLTRQIAEIGSEISTLENTEIDYESIRDEREVRDAISRLRAMLEEEQAKKDEELRMAIYTKLEKYTNRLNKIQKQKAENTRTEERIKQLKKELERVRRELERLNIEEKIIDSKKELIKDVNEYIDLYRKNLDICRGTKEIVISNLTEQLKIVYEEMIALAKEYNLFPTIIDNVAINEFFDRLLIRTEQGVITGINLFRYNEIYKLWERLCDEKLNKLYDLKILNNLIIRIALSFSGMLQCKYLLKCIQITIAKLTYILQEYLKKG